MPYEPPDRLHAYRVAESQSRLTVVDFDGEGVSPLQTCVLSTGQRPYPRRSAAAIDQELNAAAALGGSEAACQSVGPELAHSAAVPSAAVHRCNPVALAGDELIDAATIRRRHLGDQAGNAVFGPPAGIIG